MDAFAVMAKHIDHKVGLLIANFNVLLGVLKLGWGRLCLVDTVKALETHAHSHPHAQTGFFPMLTHPTIDPGGTLPLSSCPLYPHPSSSGVLCWGCYPSCISRHSAWCNVVR